MASLARLDFADAEALDQVAIPGDVFSPQVAFEPSALAHEHHQPPSRVEILPVGTQMLGDLLNPRMEQRDLRLRRARITLFLTVLGQQSIFLFLGQRHVLSQLPPDCLGGWCGKPLCASSRGSLQTTAYDARRPMDTIPARPREVKGRVVWSGMSIRESEANQLEFGVAQPARVHVLHEPPLAR